MARKHENVQKGMGEVMRGALIETSARKLLNQGISQGISQGIGRNQRETALKLLKMGKLTIDEIAECSGLSVAEIERLAERRLK